MILSLRKILKPTPRSIRNTLIVIVPLIVGFAIYFSCRGSGLLYTRWIPFKYQLGVESLQAMVNQRCIFYFKESKILDVIVFSLPGALFAFSLTFYLKRRYWRAISRRLHRKATKIYLIAAYVICIAIIPEFLQFFKILPGTYSSEDVGFALTAILVACIA